MKVSNRYAGMIRNWNSQVEFQLQDVWIGAYWKREGNCLDVWICLIPCIPLHLSFWGSAWGMPSLDPDDRTKP